MMLSTIDFWRIYIAIFSLSYLDTVYCEIDGKKDLVQANEKHYDGIPKFLQEPLPIYYVNRTDPARIICVAEPVSHVNIFCAEKQFSYMGEEVSDSSLHVIKLNAQNKPDGNGKRWKFSLLVKFKDVVEWFSEYKCYCEAWNQIIAINKAKKVHSVVTLIQESYFQNKFKKTPQSQTIEEGSRLVLSCIGPDANPKPKISWLKDDVAIAQAYQSRQLIIDNVQMSDSGNYSCMARSLDIIKRTKPAQITVAMKHYWSEWADWIQCPKACTGEHSCLNQLCTDNVRKRIRFCLRDGAKTNPENCKDEPTNTEPCDTGCEHSEKWKLWTEWSFVCSPNCSKMRSRRCDINTCKGVQTETRNCSQILCGKKDQTSAPDSQSTAMYLGLFATISVLFIIILVTLCLIVQKGYITMLPRRAMSFSSHNNGINKSYSNKHSKSKKFLISNEETSHVVSMKAQDAQLPVPSTLMDECSHTYSPVYEMYPSDGLSQIVSEIYSEFPVLSKPTVLQPLNIPLISNEVPKDRRFIENVLKDSKANDSKSRPTIDLYHELSNERSNVIWATFSSSGGRLNIYETGITVTIPNGAIYSEDVFLAVCRDPTITAAIDDSEILLSPVVICGPTSLRPTKPFIVTLPHCVDCLSKNWRIRILTSDCPSIKIPAHWKELSVIHPVNATDTHVYAQIDLTSSHVMVERPQMMCIVGQLSPVAEGPILIRLRLLTFSLALNSEQNHTIRLHIVPDTKEAMENVMYSELKMNGQFIDSSKRMTFSSSGEDVTICLEDLSAGWRCHRKCQVISHSSIWKLNHTKSCESHFILERVDGSKFGFSCNIFIQQMEVPQSRVNIPINKVCSNDRRISGADSPGSTTITSDFSQTYLDPLEPIFRLSQAARQRLWPLLDPCWESLALHMNLNGNLKYFGARNSPSDALLDLWEVRSRDRGGITELVNIFNDINRIDCVLIIEQDIMARSMTAVIPL